MNGNDQHKKGEMKQICMNIYTKYWQRNDLIQAREKCMLYNNIRKLFVEADKKWLPNVRYKHIQEDFKIKFKSTRMFFFLRQRVGEGGQKISLFSFDLN